MKPNLYKAWQLPVSQLISNSRANWNQAKGKMSQFH